MPKVKGQSLGVSVKSGIIAPHEIHGGRLAELYELRDLAQANWKGFRMK